MDSFLKQPVPLIVLVILTIGLTAGFSVANSEEAESGDTTAIETPVQNTNNALS